MRTFKTENEAQQYLEKRIPTEEKDRLDSAPLREKLFDAPAPETSAPGHYEFEGEHGLKVSFDLTPRMYSLFS